MGGSTFKGSVQVRSTSTGYAVKMKGQTDAHDLGHALAAIITYYVDMVRKAHPGCDVAELRQTVAEGIACGLEHNPEPLRKH